MCVCVCVCVCWGCGVCGGTLWSRAEVSARPAQFPTPALMGTESLCPRQTKEDRARIKSTAFIRTHIFHRKRNVASGPVVWKTVQCRFVLLALLTPGAGSPRHQAQQLHLSEAPLQTQPWAHLAQPTGQQEQRPGEARAACSRTTRCPEPPFPAAGLAPAALRPRP